MKAKVMLKALENMREDAIICFGAGHEPNWVRGFAQFSQDNRILYLMDEAPGAQGMMITVEILQKYSVLKAHRFSRGMKKHELLSYMESHSQKSNLSYSLYMK